MVGFSEQFRRARQVIEDVFARETPGARSCPPAVGCMTEVPRIALNAADLAAHADFLSIGSNDLTQFTLAVSGTTRKSASATLRRHPVTLRRHGG